MCEMKLSISYRATVKKLMIINGISHHDQHLQNLHQPSAQQDFFFLMSHPPISAKLITNTISVTGQVCTSQLQIFFKYSRRGPPGGSVS